MRVLYITNSAKIGGANRVLLQLWAALKCSGITPLAVCPADGPMPSACADLEVPCDVLPYPQIGRAHPLQTWSGFRRWAALLNRLQVDLIHANDASGARSISLAAFSRRIPLLCHVHYPPDRDHVRWVFRLL